MKIKAGIIPDLQEEDDAYNMADKCAVLWNVLEYSESSNAAQMFMIVSMSCCPSCALLANKFTARDPGSLLCKNNP